MAPSFSKEQQAWLREKAQPFLTPEPLSTTRLDQVDFSDLEHFGTLVKDAQIIALGEATHGTSEFFKLKHRLLQYAIRDLGVRTFILEDNQLQVERVNRYVLLGEGDARTVMRGLFAVWNTQEMLELVKWVRAYNEAHPSDPVAFMGMDVQNPQLALEQLQRTLSENDAELANLTDSLLADFRENWQMSFFKSDEDLQMWEDQAESAFTAITTKAEQWMLDADSQADSLAIVWTQQKARLLWQCTRSMLSGGFEGGGGGGGEGRKRK